ncbi:hypothetical protein [Pinirhizobacter sp.]|uniref:hypothetical protein n=1 Tax=Pinirhizobacter sp. TaxID=2950432 RepID=UPI002F42B36C
MKLAIVAYGLLGLAALFGLGEWHGHHRGYTDGVSATKKDADKKVDDAHVERDRYRDERDVVNSTLNQVKASLQAQRSQLDAIRNMANAALDARDALQHDLDVTTQKLKAALTKAAHEDPQCADLARLPVCPTVADRLWGNPARDQGAPDH